MEPTITITAISIVNNRLLKAEVTLSADASVTTEIAADRAMIALRHMEKSSDMFPGHNIKRQPMEREALIDAIQRSSNQMISEMK